MTKTTAATNLCTCPLSSNVIPDAPLDEMENTLAQCDNLGAIFHQVICSGYL